MALVGQEFTNWRLFSTFIRVKRMMVRWFYTVLLICFVCVGGSCRSSKESAKDKMNMQNRFESLFQESLTAAGERYHQVRGEIVSMPRSIDSNLSKEITDGDWRVSLQARIFTGWRQAHERYEYIRRVAFGKEPGLGGERSITGEPPLENSVKALADLGVQYLPALLEILSKESDSVSSYAFDVVTKTILQWGAQESLPVYRELLLNPAVAPAYRERSIMPLVKMGKEGLFDDLLSVYDRKENDRELRAAALITMGALGDPRAHRLLENAFTDPAGDIRLRGAAAYGLVESHHPAAANLLFEQYQETAEFKLRQDILFAAGMSKDRSFVGPLLRIKDKESDPKLRELIERTLEDLKRQD